MPTDRFFVALAALVWPLFGAGPALAQSSPWWAGAALNLTHDSNIYRQADGAAPLPAGRGRSDTILTSSLLAGLDQPIGRQHLRADVALRNNRFASNEVLDNNGYGLKLGLDWATIGRVSGSLGVAAERSLVRFDSGSLEAGTLERNTVSSRRVDGTVRVGVVTRWSAEASFSRQQVDYSAASFDSSDFVHTSLGTALRYSPSDLLSVSAGLSGRQGRYPRFARTHDGGFVAERYSGRNLDLTARWAPSGSSQLDGRVSLGKTSFDRVTARDVSGLTGQVAWTFRPTGKLRTEIRWTRDRGQDVELLGFDASGRVADFSRTSNALALGLHYELSAKITLSSRVTAIRRDLVDSRLDLLGDMVVRNGSDRSVLAQLGARWAPSRGLQVGCDWGREKRSADNVLSTGYGVNTVGCFGQITLQ
jgi:hypothetical protein